MVSKGQSSPYSPECGLQTCSVATSGAVIEMSYQFEGRPVGQKPAQPSVSLLGWYPCRLGFRSVRLVEVSREINK